MSGPRSRPLLPEPTIRPYASSLSARRGLIRRRRGAGVVARRRLQVEGGDWEDADDAGNTQFVVEGASGGKPTERAPEALDFQPPMAASEGVVC